MEDKIEHVVEQVENLIDNYYVDYNIKYPDDLSSKSIKAKFEVSQIKLQKTSDIYNEVLQQMAKQWLDRDMAIIKAKELQALAADMLLRMDNLYKLLNKSFWVGTVGVAGLHEQMLACNKFLWACQDFYNAHRCQKKWQLWKRLLKIRKATGWRIQMSSGTRRKKFRRIWSQEWNPSASWSWMP